ncbi:spore germination protein [Fictibacillus sp. 18YEL24]|uniref:spore germination protein n=1 Tax=Fictibacillus sp. 18YEL24 TaxID=2745875 RepID=UPI0018CE6400|nr:spore germination protein [Fictibacillus sp. 18YEL24]MBH0171471.1 spore germination protein [Fictibacillus sp. 18YEL24]
MSDLYKKLMDEQINTDDVITVILKLKEQFGNPSDLNIRNFKVQDIEILVVSLKGITDENSISQFIIKPLSETSTFSSLESVSKKSLAVSDIENTLVNLNEVKRISSWGELCAEVLNGNTAIIIESFHKVLIAGTKKEESRAITESSTETVIRGPKDSFNENLITNLSLIRNRIKNSQLRINTLVIGDVTKTDVSIVYIEGIAEERIVQELTKRLQAFKIDGILESGYIESFIQDHPYSPFPTVMNTERPDVVCGNLLEGRVSVFVSGTPFALIIPVTLMQFFQSPEDYYQRFDIGSFLRILRIAAFFVSLLAPAVYISLTVHHQGMIPTFLAFSIAGQRENVPFPTIVEVLIMEIAFEFLREAGIRMPRGIGSAASIVGALILGQAAVQAGIVSAATIIVVSTTAISSLTLPTYNIAITSRLLRFIFIFLAGVYGLYGIIVGLLIMGLHLSKLHSFGVPYLTPLAPLIVREQEDTFLRMPFQFMKKRPVTAKRTNRKRFSKGES